MDRRIITFVLALVLIPSIVFARGLALLGGSKQIAQYCAACPDTATNGDVACEVSDGTADGLCTWTIDETGGATGDVDFATACDNSPALNCADIPMTYCVAVTKTNTTASANLIAYKASTATTQYMQFYVKITAESLANGDSWTLAGWRQSGDHTNGTVRVLLYQTGGLLYFQMQYHIAAGWQIDTGGTAISTDTWYGIRMYLNDPAGGGSDSIRWWVDYSGVGTWTEEGNITSLTFDRATGYLGIGNIDTAIPITYHITGLKVDDDTMPNGCVR